MSHAPAVALVDDRFARLAAIPWWDQARLRRARVLVVGAGALGNEVIKNLALLGVGQLVIVDQDQIELSNLSRSVLYRAADAGADKATCAARAARELYPDIQATAVVGNVLADIGLGYFRWAEVVIGALDNREARVFLNQACAQVGRPWLDGGIEVLQGIVRGFAPPTTACYECTMSQRDWELVNQRRSCSLLAKRAIAAAGTPTTATTASVIGAIQAQEAVKLLHGMDAFLGHGFFFDGVAHDSYRIQYPIKPDCPWHEPAAAVTSQPTWGRHTPLATVWAEASAALGGLTELLLARELVGAFACPACQQRQEVWQSIVRVTAAHVRCPRCGAEGVPQLVHRFGPEAAQETRTLAQLGLPAWDVLWARRGLAVSGFELTGDRPAALTV